MTIYLLSNNNYYYFYRDNPPVFMTDLEQGYKQNKAKLGLKHVRPWKWMPFTNPARKVK